MREPWAGDDVLELGASRSLVRGGDGADTIAFSAYYLVEVPRADLDTVLDFGPSDRIDLASLDTDEASPGFQPARFIGKAAFSGSGQVRYEVSGGDTIVLVDGDGDRRANLAVRLEGTPTLTAADFDLGVRTSDGPDRFQGTPGDDVVRGEGGDDVLLGAGGDDTLDGGAGTDVLEGGRGRDLLEGGDGDFDRLDGGPGSDVLCLQGRDGEASGGDDQLGGSDAADRLSGDAGDDELRGGEGRDIVRGGEGDDRLFGDGGTDWLDGEEGDDILEGGDGSDDLYGGSGADRYVFGVDAANDFLFDGARDRVMFFEEGDLLDLTGIDANRGAAGNQAFTFIGTRAFSGAGQLRVEQDDDLLRLQASTDLDRTPEFEVAVRSPDLTLTAGDIVL